MEPGGFATNFTDSMVRPTARDRDASYGEFAGAPEAMLAGLGEALASNEEQDPQLVSDAVLDVIGAKPGQRPFRTEVDKTDMADAITPYNQHAQEVTETVFTAFGMDDMLTVKILENV